MPKISVAIAMLMLIIGNLIAVFSDALIKNLDGDGAVYQFVFFRQITAILLLLPFCIKSTKQQLLIGMKWHVLRGHVWLFGIIFMVFALNAMPLATANAIFYTAPLIMMPLAMLIYKEQLSRYSVAAALLGFIGVLIIIRPTEINWAAITALIVATTMAINHLLIRKLPKEQTVAQTLLLTNVMGIPVCLILTLFEGREWDFAPIITAAGSSLFILIYAAICVIVYRAVESNKIASAEYSGLVAAIVVGLIWFDEVPDYPMLIGTCLIVVPLIWLSKVESKKHKLLQLSES